MNPFGPVFHKELLELSRQRTTYLFRALAGVGLLLVILVYANDTGRFETLSRVRLQAAIGANIYANWVFYQFWIVCGLIPLLVCGLVSAEREAGSLELLFTTQLTDREILLGKLASRLFFVVLLVFSALPALVILGLLGGIDFERLAKCTLLTLGAATWVAAAGLYWSTVGKRPWVACLQIYGLFAVLWALVPFAVIVSVEVYYQKNSPGGMPPRWCFFTLLTTAPYFGIAVMSEPRMMAVVGWLLDWEGVLTIVGIWLAAAGLFLFLSVRGLRVGPRPSWLGGFARVLTRLLSALWKRLFGRENRLLARRFRLRVPMFGLGLRNPVVWRNERADVYDPDGNLSRLQFLGWILMGAMVALWASMPNRGSHFYQFFLGCEVAFLHVMIAAVASPSIARERQRNSLDPMLLTELTPAQIVLGTFQGVFWSCLPTIGLIAATLVAAVYFGEMEAAFAVHYGFMAGAYSLYLLAAAVLISCAAPRPGPAVAGMVVIAALQWFLPIPTGAIYGLPTLRALHSPVDRLAMYELVLVGLVALLFAGAIILGFLLPGRGRPLAATIVLSICIPIACLFLTPLVEIPAASNFWRWASDFNANYMEPVKSWRRSDLGFQWIPFAYFAAAVAVLLIAIRRFDRIIGRGYPGRQPAAANPPFVGRNVEEGASKDPTPRNVAPETTAASVD